MLFFALSLTLALGGRVVDKSGQPLAGVAVTLEKQKLSGVTDAQGRFSFVTGVVSAPQARRGAPAPGFSADGRLLRARAGVLRLAKRGAATDPGAAKVEAAGDDTLALSKTAYLPRRAAVTSADNDLGDITLYPQVEGTRSDYVGVSGKAFGVNMYTFTLSGKTCYLVVPKKPAPGNPWIWKTYFWTHKPYIDSILVDKGYYLAFINLPNMYGAPSAVASMDELYAHVTAGYGLSKKAILLGISRGGLYAYNWARPNLAKVSAIYGDAPVMDFVSWPCGCYGTGSGGAGEWSDLKTVYGFSGDAEAKAYKLNPYQSMKGFADLKIPMINVYGEADTVVPPKENTLRANDSLKAHGWQMKLLPKPATGHVHGLRPGVDGGQPGQLDTLIAFILRNTTF